MLKTSWLAPLLRLQPLPGRFSPAFCYDVAKSGPGSTANGCPSNTCTASPKRWWQGGVQAAFVVMALLGRPQPAAACDWYSPLCWAEEEFDYVWDGVKGSLTLAWDIITLKPEDVWEDFQDLAYNSVCGHFTVLSYAVAYGVERHFDQCDGPAEPIHPAILQKLRLYFKSSLDTVRIKQGCNLGDGREGITFG
jgi:hypothetical protein